MRDDEAQETESSTTPKRGKPDRFGLWVTVGFAVFFVVALLAWRRARAPSRMWAQRVTERHARDLDRPLARCFGENVKTGAELRRLADQIENGPLPQPLSACHTGPISELLIAPNSFVEVLRDAPVQVYALRDRERSALHRLNASYRLLERAVTVGGANPTVEQRRAIARRIEDAAPGVDYERQTVEDLIAAARDAAGWF